MLHIRKTHCAVLGFLMIGCIQACSVGAPADNPEVIALINEHLPKNAYKTVREENGAEYIFSLSIPDNKEALAILPHVGKLTRLTTLSIAYEKLADRDLQVLPQLPGLKRFGMANNKVTDDGLKYLAGMTELRELRITGIKGIRGPGLASMKVSSKLDWLYASGSGFDDSAIPHVVQNFPLLRRFDFDETNVTSEGYKQLGELPRLTTLAVPRNIAGERQDPDRKSRMLRLSTEFLRAQNAARRRARDAGEVDIPPDNVLPKGNADSR
jgi:hypothetical protein